MGWSAQGLREKCERVDHSEARRWWEAGYAETPATQARRFHILSGAIFPIYDEIMGPSGTHNVKIARATLVDGRPPGRLEPEPLRRAER
jgi:hypothetical protein